MSVIIQSPHQRISKNTRQLIEEKFRRFDKKYDRIENCRVVLKKEKNQQQERCIVEARLEVPGKDLFARDAADGFLKAAETVCIDLENQIKKHKGKLSHKHVRPADELLAT
jgi:putative sigma-54 modulation protein